MGLSTTAHAVRRSRPRVGDALIRHPLARRLRFSFPVDDLKRDLDGIEASWWRPHLGPYHDGGWESVSLWAPGGDLHNQHSFGAPLGPTPALERSPAFQAVLAAFPCPRSRARLMRLRPGARILPHSDPIEQIAPDLLRVHVPVQTSPLILFRIGGRRLEMQPGEAWHVDVRFSHEVHNASTMHRVHLVVDLIPGAHVRGLLEGSISVGSGWLTGYVLRQMLPGRVRLWLGLAN